MSNLQQKVLNYEGLQYFYNGLIKQFAPIDHASTTDIFGVGSTINYGHLKVGSNISVSSGIISLSKDNVTSALGYVPPTTDTNTTYTLSGKASGDTWITTLTPSSGAATTSTVPAMGAATSSTAGSSGLVPTPAAGKQNSFLRGDGTWAVPVDTKVTQTATEPTSVDTWYLLGGNSASDITTTALKNNALKVQVLQGTTSTEGYIALTLGNDTASGTDGNKRGQISIYSSSNGYHIIEGENSTSNFIHTLPAATGTLLNTGNYTSYTVKKDGTGASGDWNINAATASAWKTARTLTIGAKAQSVNGNANVSWSLYDILRVGTIGNETSWEIAEPGVYAVAGTDFTGSGNPEATNGGLAPYRYGQLIVSKGAPTGALAEFYISHADSKPNATQYGIKFRTGWNGVYQTTWRTLVDNVNISNFAISTNGGTLTGGNLIIDRGTEEPKYALYRTISDVVHRGLLNIDSDGAVKLGYYDANWVPLNYIILNPNATTLGKPLAIDSGGTGATTAPNARVALGICSTTADIVYNSSNIIASSTEPTNPTEGMIWLKI